MALSSPESRYPVGATLREALASVPASAPLVHLRNREVAKTNGRYIFDSSYNFFVPHRALG